MEKPSFQVKVKAQKGTSPESFIAVDEFAFLQTDVLCDLMPPEAKPPEPPVTTTTPAPTEPPGRKFISLT